MISAAILGDPPCYVAHPNHERPNSDPRYNHFQSATSPILSKLHSAWPLRLWLQSWAQDCETFAMDVTTATLEPVNGHVTVPAADEGDRVNLHSQRLPLSQFSI